jgi:hypothetical protein
VPKVKANHKASSLRAGKQLGKVAFSTDLDDTRPSDLSSKLYVYIAMVAITTELWQTIHAPGDSRLPHHYNNM